MEPEELTTQFPTQGWRQILNERKRILDAYDHAREQARRRPVETLHGNVVEGEFRKWLSDFLPKRFDVSSGFIISAGLPDEAKSPEFDVIVYDRLESPVLWVEDNPDSSNQWKKRAIPVEPSQFWR
jgi:hypothetical protein